MLPSKTSHTPVVFCGRGLLEEKRSEGGKSCACWLRQQICLVLTGLMCFETASVCPSVILAVPRRGKKEI